jgi:hypothetical protein
VAIRSQELTRNALTIVGPDGTVYAVNKEMVQAYYKDNTSGNAASRRQQVIDWYLAGLVTAFGAGVDPAELFLDFDVLDGGWKNAEWTTKDAPP